MALPQVLIDAHIHLWPRDTANNESHSWMLPGEHLTRKYSIEDYDTARKPASDRFKTGAFVFVETDAAIGPNSNQVSSWAAEPLREIAFLRRIDEGRPREGEGFNASPSCLLAGIVAWAPLDRPLPDLLSYMSRAKEVAGERTWTKIKGFRFLLQGIRDQDTFMKLLDPTASSFTAMLRFLGTRGLSFDVGVDQRQAGAWQLEAFAECVENVHVDVPSEEKTVFILNHLCKPNMEQRPEQSVETAMEFERWKAAITKMARHDKVYMKLSGGFSEMAIQDPANPMPIDDLLDRMSPWLDHIFSVFGPGRIMYGSDWPVCNVRGPGDANAWTHWTLCVDQMLRSRALSQADKDRIWFGTAIEAYRLDV